MNCHVPLCNAITHPTTNGQNNNKHNIVDGHLISNGSNGGNQPPPTAECVTMTIDNRCTKMAIITIAAFIAFNLLAGEFINLKNIFIL
jgi:hypothetical protein